MTQRSRTVTRATLAIVLGLGAACGDSSGPPPYTPPASRPTLDAAWRPSGRAASGHTFVHLFEWKWTDIARECETVLGPAGFSAVQVSPPQEHSVQSSHTWSQRYQPVSYSIESSRSGTGADFRDMIARCRTAGVGIYVDAVINHMTNTPSPGVGSNGTAYAKYSYPGLYEPGDFHPACTVSNYQSPANVQDCELFGLPDLNTGSAVVRQRIANYLVGLARLGVAGFRIDAAKHIQPVELDAILGLVNQALADEGLPLPFVFAEVIDYGNEAVSKNDYLGLGYASGGAADITEFKFRGVADKFMGVGGQHIAQLDPNGPPGGQFSAEAWGLLSPDKALIFLENHDTQRERGISYRDGDVYRLANVWMLAQPYGHPSVMSSYAFEQGSQLGRERGPPSDAAGATNDVVCPPSMELAQVGGWVCEHRDPAILGMVGFRRAVAGTNIGHWWDNGGNAIAFSRGSAGFVAINREGVALDSMLVTAVPPGVYCDVVTGRLTPTGCTGTSVTVGTGGLVHVVLPANRAVAIHAGSRL